MQAPTPQRKSVSNSVSVGGNAMSQPGQGSGQPARKDATAMGKAAYIRKPAAVTPTTLPMKRQKEGSVLTGGSTSSGPVQPFSRSGRQNMSSKLKGGAD